MDVELNAEQTEIVNEAIMAGLIRTPDEVIAAGVDFLRSRLHEQRQDATKTNVEEWTRELQAWVQGHSTSTSVLADSAMDRDSIYGSRGL